MRKSSAKAAQGGKAWPRYVLAGCLASSALIVTANTIAMQDVAALTGASDKSPDRWAISLVSVPVGSTAQKSQHRLQAAPDAKAKEVLAVKAGDKTRVVREIKTPAPTKPLQLDRALKGDRVVGIAPERFEVGGATELLLQSRSLLLMDGLKHQYASPQVHKLQQVAQNFHKTPKQNENNPAETIGKVPDQTKAASRIFAKVAADLPVALNADKDSVTFTGSVVSSSDAARTAIQAESPVAVHIRKSVMAAVVPAVADHKDLAKRVTRPKSAKRKLVAALHPKPTGTDPLVAEYQQIAKGSLVTSYAPQEIEKQNPFDAVLRPTLPKGRPIFDGVKKALSKFKIVLGKKDHKWALNPLPKNSYGAAQRRCLAVGIYFEARGEPVKGQQAVAQVILNRVKNPAYPRSICGVVYQNKWKRNRCQFSFACDGKRDRIRSKKHWKVAKKVANDAIEGKVWLKKVGSSSHYHADYVRPRWRRKMSRRVKIGRHIFYRTYRGGWT